MSTYRIPFNRACLVGNEMTYLAQAIENSHISGDGIFSQKCHSWFEKELGTHKALLTTSWTGHAPGIGDLIQSIPIEDLGAGGPSGRHPAPITSPAGIFLFFFQ